MEKKPICVVFNDIHIKTGNEEEVYSSVAHMVSYCVENNINEIVCNGDIFDSRSFQRLSNLQCWQACLDLFAMSDILCHVNVGNHDKTRYDSADSFLDPFTHHPAMRLYKNIQTLELFGKTVTFSPYFPDEMLEDQLKKTSGSDLLFGHWEMCGSTNLGKVSEKKTITKELLKKWKRVYLGHYHNYHEISDKIVHLPSLRQANFGEDENKGFTVIHDDLSYEIQEGRFKKFKKIVINIDETNTSELKNLIKTHKSESDTIRFEFIGDNSKLKALDKSLFEGSGIDIKIKYSVKYDFEDKDTEAPQVTEKYDEKKIKESFEEFCKEKSLDVKAGMSLLEKFFKKDG